MLAPRLIEDTSRPDLRAVWGRLLARAVCVDVAVTRVRLSTLDFGEGELARVRRVRVLVAQLSAAALDAEAHAVCARPEAAAALARLMALLEAGRISLRSAPLGGWSPDFSVFHDAAGPRVALVGPHRFDAAGPLQGPLLVSVHGRAGAARVALRFDGLWERGHDVRGPVGGILERARREAAKGAGAPPGGVALQGFSTSRRTPAPP